jgi:hypothetical protein
MQGAYGCFSGTPPANPYPCVGKMLFGKTKKTTAQLTAKKKVWAVVIK